MSRAGIFAPAAYVAQPQAAWAQPQIIQKVVALEQPANYQFQYNVNDAYSGDSHSQNERADNGVVRGSYQIADADGFLRTVDYTADDVHGFQATVRREPFLVKQIYAQPTIAKVVQTNAGPWN